MVCSERGSLVGLPAAGNELIIWYLAAALETNLHHRVHRDQVDACEDFCRWRVVRNYAALGLNEAVTLYETEDMSATGRGQRTSPHDERRQNRRLRIEDASGTVEDRIHDNQHLAVRLHVEWSVTPPAGINTINESAPAVMMSHEGHSHMCLRDGIFDAVRFREMLVRGRPHRQGIARVNPRARVTQQDAVFQDWVGSVSQRDYGFESGEVRQRSHRVCGGCHCRLIPVQIDQPQLVVAPHTIDAIFAEYRACLVKGDAMAGDIAEMQQAINALLIQLGNDSAEVVNVLVDVCNEPDPHMASVDPGWSG